MDNWTFTIILFCVVTTVLFNTIEFIDRKAAGELDYLDLKLEIIDKNIDRKLNWRLKENLIYSVTYSHEHIQQLVNYLTFTAASVIVFQLAHFK